MLLAFFQHFLLPTFTSLAFDNNIETKRQCYRHFYDFLAISVNLARLLLQHLQQTFMEHFSKIICDKLYKKSSITI